LWWLDLRTDRFSDAKINLIDYNNCNMSAQDIYQSTYVYTHLSFLKLCITRSWYIWFVIEVVYSIIIFMLILLGSSELLLINFIYNSLARIFFLPYNVFSKYCWIRLISCYTTINDIVIVYHKSEKITPIIIENTKIPIFHWQQI